MRVYRGYVDDQLECQVEVREDGELIGPLTHHQLHSPTGFAWGYGGSGPSELARCLLLDALGHDEEYHTFKWVYVANWIGEWSITDDEIEDWYASRDILEA